MNSSDSVELVLRGYRAFVAGDFATVAGLLSPEVEWYGVDREGAADCEQIQEILTARFADGYRIELERCIGKGKAGGRRRHAFHRRLTVSRCASAATIAASLATAICSKSSVPGACW